MENATANDVPAEENTAARTGSGEPTLCAICLDSPDLIILPCCGSAASVTSTTRFCQACIEVICRMAGGVGMCPRCRGRLAVEGGKVVVPPPNIGRCRMCCQNGKQLVQDSLCEACLAGTRNPLRYICERCQLVQRIPHPMYRYQPTPAKYCKSSWACHQRCGGYTRWRILPEDLRFVPVADRPERWGTEDWFEEVRRIRRQGEGGAGNASDEAA
mmetsp:Transcript_15548/g.32405  ORF Transcript_15548/g.32405 Transcript_15548/m.32405 type:complete len:215 (-) Transcript_15548:284-928(-)